MTRRRSKGVTRATYQRGYAPPPPEAGLGAPEELELLDEEPDEELLDEDELELLLEEELDEEELPEELDAGVVTLTADVLALVFPAAS